MKRDIVTVDDRIIIDFGEEVRSLSLSIDEAAAFQIELYSHVKNFKKKSTGSTFDVDALADPVIPWGKYKGTKLSIIADDYLLWLLGKAEEGSLTPGWLNERVTAEWRRRNNRSKEGT